MRLSLAFLALSTLAVPMFATSYLGGVEDYSGLDYDYNDTVFTMDGTGLTLHSAASFYSKPVLSGSGTPFWNNNSLDGSNYNVGYCVYGGGSCNGGSALSANALFLAADPSSKTGSANDVYFSATGAVTLKIPIQVTQAENVLGWYSLSDTGTFHALNSMGQTGSFTFNPEGDFGLEEMTYSNGQNAYDYYSQTQYGSADTVSHFAFFSDPSSTATPEPGASALAGIGLLCAGALRFRSRSAKRS